MGLCNLTEKPKIDFPCEWSYKVFGSDKVQLEEAINQVLTERPYRIVKATKSSKGKYISLTIKLTIMNQEELDMYYNALAKHASIKIVL
jgi:uncharacterized protein